MGKICSYCGKRYERLGQHWGYNPEHQPKLTNLQKDILTGVIMSDGNVKRDNDRNPYIRVRSITKDYLEYLNNIFGELSLGVDLRYTAEEKAKENNERGFTNNTSAENYSDQYLWKTRRSKQFQEFADWYSSGKKSWPTVTLTPAVLKHLYVCDGHYNNSDSNNYISISCSNERSNKEKVEEMFSNSGFNVSYWNESKRNNFGYEGTISASIVFDVPTTQDMFEFMGEPLPGFEYKWPDQNT